MIRHLSEIQHPHPRRGPTPADLALQGARRASGAARAGAADTRAVPPDRAHRRHARQLQTHEGFGYPHQNRT